MPCMMGIISTTTAIRTYGVMAGKTITITKNGLALWQFLWV